MSVMRPRVARDFGFGCLGAHTPQLLRQSCWGRGARGARTECSRSIAMVFAWILKMCVRPSNSGKPNSILRSTRPGPEQCGIQGIGPVRGHEHLHVTARIEAVQLVHNLKHCSLHLIVARSLIATSSSTRPKSTSRPRSGTPFHASKRTPILPTAVHGKQQKHGAGFPFTKPFSITRLTMLLRPDDPPGLCLYHLGKWLCRSLPRNPTWSFCHFVRHEKQATPEGADASGPGPEDIRKGTTFNNSFPKLVTATGSFAQRARHAVVEQTSHRRAG